MFFLYKGEGVATVEVEKPKLVKATYNLARKFRDMERFPRDRDLGMNRLEFIKEQIKSGQFRGSEWAQATNLQTNIIYRINGRHTSTALCDLFEQEHKFKSDITVLVREYACDDMVDMAQLYSTFDPRQSARTKANIVQGFAACSPILSEISGNSINLITAGLAFNLWEEASVRKTPQEQAMLLLQYPEFAVWALTIAKECTTNKHMRRVPVMAAMARTWFKDSIAANDFWSKVRDDCEEPLGTGARVLHKWLITHSLEGVGRKSEMINSSRREMFVRCLLGWNAWRRGEKTKLHYRSEANTPEAA